MLNDWGLGCFSAKSGQEGDYVGAPAGLSRGLLILLGLTNSRWRANYLKRLYRKTLLLQSKMATTRDCRI